MRITKLVCVVAAWTAIWLLPIAVGAQVYIPSECAGLAEKHGYSSPMSKNQARIAVAKLKFMSSRDPVVAACKEAVRVAREQARSAARAE